MFGSFATGLHLPTSDVDCVILCDDIAPSECVQALKAIGQAMQRSEWATEVEVWPICLSRSRHNLAWAAPVWCSLDPTSAALIPQAFCAPAIKVRAVQRQAETSCSLGSGFKYSYSVGCSPVSPGSRLPLQVDSAE